MYDIIIVGGGPAGYRAAEIAGKRGMRTLFVEKNAVGGVCLHEGCIPMKACLHICDIKTKAERMLTENIFQDASVPIVNLESMTKRIKKTIAALEKGIVTGLKNVGVELLTGTAKVISATKETVMVGVDEKVFSGKHLIIATGSQSMSVPSANVVQSYHVIGSTDIFTMKAVPNSMHIIGGGAIGLEAASFFQTLGTKVTVVEGLSNICGKTDVEMAQVLQKILEKQGIKFLLNTKLEEFGKSEMFCCSNGHVFEVKPEYVLFATGRKPVVDGLGLENIDVDYDEAGIAIDDKCRTTHPLIYACGDVTGKMQLAHTAYRQAAVAVDNICGKESIIDYATIPRIVYSFPTYISVGFSEEYCKENGMSCLIKILPMTYNGKYYAENGIDGCKAKLVVDADTHRLLGFHAVGHDMEELALVAEMMINNSVCLDDIRNMVFPHPTYGEIIQTLADNIE